MKGKHERTLRAVFADPIGGNIKWRTIESLVKALGGEVEEGEGSRVHFLLNGIPATFHRPHPRPDADKGAVKSVRRFLAAAGIKPEDA